MKRTVATCAVLAVLAPAAGAAAKGPHAIVDPGPEGIEPGRPWIATLTLGEFGPRAAAAARPVLILRSRGDRLVARAERLGAARYRLRAVFPHAGRWTYTVVDGTPRQRRFDFPVAHVGGSSERVTTAFVAFPEGSPAEAAGAGGELIDDAAPPAGGEPLPPEVVSPAASGSGGGGVPLWIPAAGLALVGAGTLTVVRRRRG